MSQKKVNKNKIVQLFHWTGTTNVASAEYKAYCKELIVTFFSGASYKYYDVDAFTWKEFCEASSPGRFVHTVLINHNGERIS